MWVWVNSGSWWWTREAWLAAIHGVAKSRTQLSDWSDLIWMFKVDLEKAEEPGIKLPTSVGSSKKQESSRKTSISALLNMPKPLTVWITTTCGKFLKRWEYQTTWPASWEICMQVRKQVRIGDGTTDWFQIGNGVLQGCILSPCLFNLYTQYIMRNAGLESRKAQAGIKIPGEYMLGEILITSDMQMTPPF